MSSTICVKITSGSLGDTLAWVPYVDLLQKQKGVSVTCCCNFPELFKSSYPQINFVDHQHEEVYDYTIDWGFRNDVPLQQIASDSLNFPYKEIRPKVDVEKSPRPIKGKYVCIATQSTAQAKYWNYTNGWNFVVKHLKRKGYKVVVIDKYYSYGNEDRGYMNVCPKGVINKTGEFPLSERIQYLKHCSFFIGLPSGLSWLAWAVGKPVIMISGFSEPYSEFECNRIYPSSGCRGCWNKFKFDSSDWLWCPSDEKTKRFECTRSIPPSLVYKEISKIERFLQK